MSGSATSSTSGTRNGSTTGSTFNGTDVATYFSSTWSRVLERSNSPNVPPAEQPEIFRVPGGPGGAWGGGGAAWGAARPGNHTTMSDGQQFTVGLSKALYQYNQSAKKS